MDQKRIDHCYNLIKKYKLLKDEKARQKIRNTLFDLMFDDLLKWINSLLSKKKIFISQQETISLSWDCFEFGLSKFDEAKNITVPKHFYAHCNYYMMTFWMKQNKNEDLVEESELDDYANDYGAVYEIQDGIRIFRDGLTPKYQKIFDDALLSMSQNSKDRVRNVDEMHIPYYRYDEAKKCFKMILNFILKKK